MQVESLQAIIKDKTEDYASLLVANQQGQRDLAERNDEIDKLAGRIRELEQALLNSAENHRLASQLEQELHRVKLKEQELTQVRNVDSYIMYILKKLISLHPGIHFSICMNNFSG